MVSTPEQHSRVAGTGQKKRVSPAYAEHSALSLSSWGGGDGRRGTQVKDWRGGRGEVEGRMDGEREGKRGGETERAEGGGEDAVISSTSPSEKLQVLTRSEQ